VVIVPVVLHVGWGTFAPIRETDIRGHHMHAEWGEISAASRKKLLAARKAAHQKSAARIFAVGTTALRVVEAAARDNQHQKGKWTGWISLYLKPGDSLKIINGLLTNFHLPKTTLFVLVCSILGTKQAQAVYAVAQKRGYRWASFGDAMLILPRR
jgi:S-adenosylmethionine:tRNA ribosyltransferase-isomerase